MRLGLDLGGTKIEVVALDSSEHERLRRRIATPQGDYAATLRAIIDLITAAEADLACRATVGLGIPGSLSVQSGRVRNANSTCLNGQPLQADLERLLGRSVRIENDANCLALSEATDGAAQGAAVAFAVILGTGVGGGLVVNGQLVSGRNRIAGEWGHNPLPWPTSAEWDGPPCWCGRRGCLETWLSGPALAASYSPIADAIALEAAAEAGDSLAIGALALWLDRCARALASIVNVIDPDVIVLGGGLSKIRDLPTRLQAYWEPWIFSDRVETRIVTARYGDSSGVRGAARLWPAGPEVG
jgi:predicted NBD/HSP70 family sugar kinase